MPAPIANLTQRRTELSYGPPPSPLPSAIARLPLQGDFAAARDRAISRFATELSPANGPEFFSRLVEYIADCLGFDVVVVAELPLGGDGQLHPIATYPANVSSSAVLRAMIGDHCDRLVESGFSGLTDAGSEVAFDLPIVGSGGRPIGVICGFGRAAKVDEATRSMMLSIVSHRAAAEMERQRAARDLESRDALYIGLVAETHDVVGVLGAQDCFTAVSPAIERVLGFCAETCSGLPVAQLVHPLDRESVAALLRISDPQGYSVEARLRKADGEWLPMAVTIAEHQDADGRTIRVVSARDLTDRRRLEDRLRQSQKTEMIGRLATGIAHDFGNILMVVRSHADVMRLRTTADDPRHSSVDAIQSAVSRGADLARQLLAFSRHRESEMRRVDINASIEQLAALLRRLVGSTIRLETELSPDARSIAGDVTQFEQIVLNLALNARDAMPNGGKISFATTPVAAGIDLPEIVAASPDDFLCFSVTDTGCGIREEVLPHIFEPLFTTKQEGGGNGIGLATVHDIVMRHGGCIEVQSAEGQGTTFRIYLPRNIAPTRKGNAL